MVDALRGARKQQLAERLALGPAYAGGEYVACDEAGYPYHPHLLSSRWGRMLDTLGIKRVRFHDARHTCATLMHLRGVPIAVVSKWLGHYSPAFTMAVYTHGTEDALRAAQVAFDRQLNRDVTTGDTDGGTVQ